MKKLSLLSLLFMCFLAKSQNIQPRTNGSTTVQDGRLSVPINLIIPRYLDTTAANVAFQLGIDSCGALIYTYSNKKVWVRLCSPKKWALIYSDAEAIAANVDSISSKVNKWQNQTIAGQLTLSKPLVINNGIIGGSISANILHRENLTAANSTGIALVPNNVSTISGLNKVTFALKDTASITSDTALWDGMKVFFINSGTKMGRVRGFYYDGGGTWTGQEIAFGNSRGNNAFNETSGLMGVGLPNISIAAKLHIKNTNNVGGDVFLLQDATSNPLLKVNNAGSLGIGVSSPATTAIIDATSTTKGVLFPRMTTTQKNAITLDASNDGLMVYDITLHKLFINENGTWIQK